MHREPRRWYQHSVIKFVVPAAVLMILVLGLVPLSLGSSKAVHTQLSSATLGSANAALTYTRPAATGHHTFPKRHHHRHHPKPTPTPTTPSTTPSATPTTPTTPAPSDPPTAPPTTAVVDPTPSASTSGPSITTPPADPTTTAPEPDPTTAAPTVDPTTPGPDPTTPAPTPTTPTTTVPVTTQPTTAAPTTSPTPSAPASTGDAALEDEVIALTNVERAKVGCGPVTKDAALVTAARKHAGFELANQAEGHLFPGEQDLGTRFTAAGYTGWTSIGENAAGGPGGVWWVDAHSVMYGGSFTKTVNGVSTTFNSGGWMQDEGHRDNILNCGFKDIGVGAVRDDNGAIWWSQEFGNRG